jgi:enoyl-CoA hydratase/carnithine racemase
MTGQGRPIASFAHVCHSLVRDLVSLIQRAEGEDEAVKVLVFQARRRRLFHFPRRRDQDQRVPNGGGEVDRRSVDRAAVSLSERSRLVTIAQIEDRIRAAGNEFVLVCDMRFAAREKAIFSQFEPSFGVIPDEGARSHVERGRLRRNSCQETVGLDQSQGKTMR